MKHSNSGLFLMELIISILFFSLASAVCIQLFAKSHLLSKQTREENQAVIQAQNLAEVWLAAEGDPDQIRAILPDSCFDPAACELVLYFDSEWNCIPDSDTSVYMAVLSMTDTAVSEVPADALMQAEIKIMDRESDPDSGESIYSLNLVHHIAQKRGATNES